MIDSQGRAGRTCPTRDQLAALLSDGLAPPDRLGVERHLEGCPSCQAALDLLCVAEGPLPMPTHAASAPDGPRPSFVRGLAGSLRPATGSQTCDDSAPPAVPGYEVQGELGRGGMGVVYRAQDRGLRRPVAVKVLQDRFVRSAAAVARFRAEARITAQLQHPGIPAVHQEGTLADGRPFLAMKLVKGHTLRDLLKDRTAAADDLGRFVAVFEQLAHAVGFAHAHQVVHRDLKPANVMVGAHGEVQVMDWGLAKRRDEGGPGGPTPADPEVPTAPVTEVSTPACEESDTRTGSVLGTPAYMPPEQAAGDVRKLDARSDVFALGATLCEILTGRSPYLGGDAQAVRIQAIRGETREALARLDECGAEPELVALCKRCLAFEQVDRPADGHAVAAAVAAIRQAAEARARQAELDRERAAVRAAEQGRRRRILVAAGGLVVAALTGGLGASLWQMNRANAERDARGAALEAETRAREDEARARARAFEALRTMVAEVVERKFAQGAVLTDNDKAFLRGVIAQFDAFADIQGDDARSRAVRAEGRYRVGEMQYRLGEFNEAEADYDVALALYGQLAAEFPDRPEYRYNLSGAHNNRGLVLRETGRLRKAEADYDAALAVNERLAADFPDRPEYRQALADGRNNRGLRLSESNRLDEAARDYAAALDIYTRLAADVPGRPTYRQNLAAIRHNRGNLHVDAGRPKEAAADYDAALAVQEELAANSSGRPDVRRELAKTHNSRGLLMAATKRPKEAEQDFDAALGVLKRLAADFPAWPEFRQELAWTHNNRGLLLKDTGRLKEAEADYDAALGLQKQLAADFPDRPAFRRELAGSYSNRGTLRIDAGRPKDGLADFDTSLGIRKQLAADFPDQPDIRNELAGACLNLALFHQQGGDAAAAKRLLVDGRPHHLAALRAGPANPDYRRLYGVHLALLVEVHAALLEREDAVRIAETRRDLHWDPAADAYDAACSLSRCIPAVEKHAKLDADQRRAAARFYGDHALRLLWGAVAEGYKNAAQLKEDTDLDPLRGREDFRKLAADVGANAAGLPDIARPPNGK